MTLPSRLSPLVIAAFAILVMSHASAADPAPQAEYDKRVEKALLEKNPQNHKALADWCKKQYPAKYQHHLDAWNSYDFARLEKLLPASPSPQELLRLSSAAGKMGIPAKEKEYRGKWGETQFALHAKKLTPGNTAMQKQLLGWAIKEKVEFIPECQTLAKDVAAGDPAYEPAHKVLGHLKLEKGWMTWEEALASIDLQDARSRLDIHRALAEQRAALPPREYPKNPTADMKEDKAGFFTTGTKKSGGEAVYHVWTRGYKPGTPCPLVISFHGGGGGGMEKSLEYSRYEPVSWQQNVKEGSWILLSPTARSHIANSWWDKDNLEDIFDMLEETFERFNIDRKRIYVTGQSMGGNGTGEWMWVFPEFAASSCARAGAYWTNWTIKDVLGKPIMVIHGEKDDKPRNESRTEFIRKTKEMGGKVEHISYPDKDHFLGAAEIFPHMIPYFTSHVNEYEPDLALLREVFRDRHKKFPQAKYIAPRDK